MLVYMYFSIFFLICLSLKDNPTKKEKYTRIEVNPSLNFKNIFNGELPTLKFKRYDREEYLKEKEE